MLDLDLWGDLGSNRGARIDPCRRTRPMIITARAIESANPLSAPDFGQDDARYLQSIAHEGRRAQAIAARLALADAFDEWRQNTRRELHSAPTPISSSQHDQVLAPYEPLERELRRMERRDEDDESARLRRRERRERLRSTGAWLLERGQWGAPRLIPRDPADPYVPSVHTALAHCDSLAVAGLSPYRNGVDVECFERPLRSAWERLATGRELAHIETLSDALARELVIRSWILKESWAKMFGDGLAHRAKQVSLRFHEGHWRLSSPLRVTAHVGTYQGHRIAALVEDFGEDPSAPHGLDVPWEAIQRDLSA